MAAYRGLLDFVGYPVGVGVLRPQGGPHVGGKVVSRLMAQALIAADRRRRELAERERTLLAQRYRRARAEDAFRDLQRQEIERVARVWGMASVLMAEV